MRVCCGWSMFPVRPVQFTRIKYESRPGWYRVQAQPPPTCGCWTRGFSVMGSCDGFQSRGSGSVFYEAVDPVCPRRRADWFPLSPDPDSGLSCAGETGSDEEEEHLGPPRVAAGDSAPPHLQAQRLLELQEQVQMESWVHLHLQE